MDNGSMVIAHLFPFKATYRTTSSNPLLKQARGLYLEPDTIGESAAILLHKQVFFLHLTWRTAEQYAIM